MDWLKNIFGSGNVQKSEDKIIDIFNNSPEEKLEAQARAKAQQEDIANKEEDENREAEEQAIEGKLVVIDGAKIKMGSHLGEFKVLNDVPSTQNKLTATTVEKQILNFTFYDGFQILSINGDWQKTGTYQVQDNEVLLKESTLQVTGKMPGNTPPETGIIEIIDPGQINIPENPDELEVLGFEEDGDEKKCPRCSNEITTDLIRQVLGVKSLNSKQQKLIDSFLPFLNKYRKEFGLDTCLRKAHFIAQIALESKFFTTFEEDEGYTSSIRLGVFSGTLKPIDSIMIESLKENLSSIFKIVDGKGAEIIKTNEQLRLILLNEKPNVIDGELYGSYKGEKDSQNPKKRKEKILKQVLKADKSIDYKILLIPHTYFGVPLMSRAYAPFPGDARGLGNNDELSRDGWKFKGRGLKQVTGRENYKIFTTYRNKNSFPDDNSGQIDFTKEKEGLTLQGNYLKLSNNPMYAVQSALWFWNAGTKYNKKTAKEHADKDDVDSVSKAINKYDTKALPLRSKNYERAKIAFKISEHYKDIKT